jgi:hypothetical protein
VGGVVAGTVGSGGAVTGGKVGGDVVVVSAGTILMITIVPAGASVPGAGLCCQIWPSVY